MLNNLMADETAGDPMSTLKWSRKDTRELSQQMKNKGISISATTVGSMLKDAGYSLRVNRKSINETNHPDRDLQFTHIRNERNRFGDCDVPVVSIDSKKKELIGNFKNNGKIWRNKDRNVYTHDFRSNAEALATPYGIYECLKNQGTVVIGTSRDTAEFAVDSIELWLKTYALESYPSMSKFLILCDSGGSNGCRPRLWKVRLYEQIAQKYGLEIFVCHYPAGASKWNPVEHKLFSYISMEWQGEPLVSLDLMKNKIEATKTKSGLKVRVIINDKKYEKGIKVPDKYFSAINIKYNDILPKWNYKICPN
jgi:hypothetical protein